MKRHITRALALVLTLMMILTSVPFSALPVFASAVSGTTTAGEEELDGFELRASQATLGKEYYALGDHMTGVDHTDGKVDSSISAYEPSGTNNALDPFLIGGDAWINLDEIYYGAPAMPTFALSAWSANTSVVNTTHFGQEVGEDGKTHWTYTFPDMNLIDETLWGDSVLKFDFNDGARGSITTEDAVSVEGVISSEIPYVGKKVDGKYDYTNRTANVTAKNDLAAYTYNRYDDMQAKWGLTMDKNTASVEFTPVNRELFLTKTPYLYFSNEQTHDTKMAISLLIGTPVIDDTVTCNYNTGEPGVVTVYRRFDSDELVDLNNTKSGMAPDYYKSLKIGDWFDDNGNIYKITSQSQIDELSLQSITISNKSVNVRLTSNQTIYKKNADGSYVYDYKWYTVTDSNPHPGVANESMKWSMTPSVIVSDPVNADGTLKEGGNYVVPDTEDLSGYVTGALTGCIDFTHILDVIYSHNYTGVKYDVAKVRIDMKDVDESVKTAGRINYLYFAPACEDVFTPQVSAGMVESADNVITEGWENGATVTVTDTPENPQVITVDTTGANGKTVYYDNELDVQYMLYLQKYAKIMRGDAHYDKLINKETVLTEKEYAAANGYSTAKSYNEYIDKYTTYLHGLASAARLQRTDFVVETNLDDGTPYYINYESYLKSLLTFFDGYYNDWNWFLKNAGNLNGKSYPNDAKGYWAYLEDEVAEALEENPLESRETFKNNNPKYEDIDYVTVKIPVRKYINSLSDARKFSMTVNVTQWVDATGKAVENQSDAVKKGNGAVATPTIMLWGCKNGAAGSSRSYWYDTSLSDPLNYGCRFANDGMLAVLGNGVYLAEPRYWYESATVDRTLGNSTVYDGTQETWYDLVRSPYMYDETITTANATYPKEMVGYVYVSNMTVCVPKGMKLTITGARCSGNSAGLNMQDTEGEVVNAFDGGSGVNPVVNDNVIKGETNKTGDVVSQSGVNITAKPAAYGPYLRFSDYTIGNLINDDEVVIFGQSWFDRTAKMADEYKNNKKYRAIHAEPSAGSETLGYRDSAGGSFVVYATVQIGTSSTASVWGAVGVMKEDGNVPSTYDGHTVNEVESWASDNHFGWTCLCYNGTYTAAQADYRTGTVLSWSFPYYDAFTAYFKNTLNRSWKQVLYEAMQDKWTYSNMGGFGNFLLADGSEAEDKANTGANYYYHNRKPTAHTLVQYYHTSDYAGEAIKDSTNNVQYKYTSIPMYANQGRYAANVNSAAILGAWPTGTTFPEWSVFDAMPEDGPLANPDALSGVYNKLVNGTITADEANKQIDETKMYNGVYNTEMYWPRGWNADLELKTHSGTGIANNEDWKKNAETNFRSKIANGTIFTTRPVTFTNGKKANAAVAVSRVLSNPLTARLGSTSNTYPVLYYDMETTHASAVIALYVALPEYLDPNDHSKGVQNSDVQVFYIDCATNKLVKSVPAKDYFTAPNNPAEEVTHSGQDGNSVDNASRNVPKAGGTVTGYVRLDDLIKEYSHIGRIKIVGVGLSTWDNTGNEHSTTIRRLELQYEKEPYLDQNKYSDIADYTSYTNDDLNVLTSCTPKSNVNAGTGAQVATEVRSDGTLLIKKDYAGTKEESSGTAISINKDISGYNYLNIKLVAECPFLISWYTSKVSQNWGGTSSDCKTQIGTSNYAATAPDGHTGSLKAGSYSLSIKLSDCASFAKDMTIGGMFIEPHCLTGGKIAISEISFSKTSGCKNPYPNLTKDGNISDTPYEYNIHQYKKTVRTGFLNDSFNVLNDVFYYNQEYSTDGRTMTINPEGKRGWHGYVRKDTTVDGANKVLFYYSDGSVNNAQYVEGENKDTNVVITGDQEGIYQYRTSLGHLRVWVDPNKNGQIALNSELAFNIQNYRYLYYSYSMRDESGLAVQDEETVNGKENGIQMVLKSGWQNSTAGFVEVDDTWQYHTTYDSHAWSDGNTSASTGSGKKGVRENNTKSDWCMCSLCDTAKTGTDWEPEASYKVSANGAVDLWEVYSQEKARSGCLNYKDADATTATVPSETTIEQIVFNLKNSTDKPAEFYINYIYLSNTPIADNMQPIFEMEEHQFYYLMDNTGTRYSARFPTLDNPTGQITGAVTSNRNQKRNNPVVVERGDLLDDAMFSTGQGFKESDITDYNSMAATKADAEAAEKLWLKTEEGITMTEAVWFYENHFPEIVDGVQQENPDTDILDYYKYVAPIVDADGNVTGYADGTAKDMRWSLGRWYVGDGTNALNVMKKDASNEVVGGLTKRYAVDNRVLLRSGIRPRTYTTYYDTDGGAMYYEGSSDDIKNGALVNVDNYYITESPLNFFYTWPVDGPDMIEPVKPGYVFTGWVLRSAHGAESVPLQNHDLRTYHIKNIAKVDYFEATWEAEDKYKDDVTAQNALVTAQFFVDEAALKNTQTWFTRDTSWKRGFKMTLPAVSRIKTSDGIERIYGWKMVTYDAATGKVTETGKTYNLGATIWLTENALFLPDMTVPENQDPTLNLELPTVTITLQNATLWTRVDGDVQAHVGCTGATETDLGGGVMKYEGVPRNAALFAVPMSTYRGKGYVWRLNSEYDNVTNVNLDENANANVDHVLSTNELVAFNAVADCTLQYTTPAKTPTKKVFVQTYPSTYVANRQMKFYTHFTVAEDFDYENVLACGTLYTKKGSTLYNIAGARDDAGNLIYDDKGNVVIDPKALGENMQIDEKTITDDTIPVGSYQTVDTSNVRLAMQDMSALTEARMYYLMATVKGDKAATYYMRGYVIYKDGNDIKVAYSDVVVSESLKESTSSAAA